MKIKPNLLLVLALAFGFASCEYDNYDAPEAMLQGSIVYNGEPIQVASNQVSFELWEPGWQLRDPIDVAVAQDGSYSASLFEGPYKLVFRPSQGPFRMKMNPETNSDTIAVNVSGTTVMDVEVIPYWIINNPQFSLSGGMVNATASLEQIITDENARNVERVSLILNKTQFVDDRPEYRIAKTDVAANTITDLSNISLSVEVPSLIRPQSFIYARIGVKMEGLEHLIYSPVQRFEL